MKVLILKSEIDYITSRIDFVNSDLDLKKCKKVVFAPKKQDSHFFFLGPKNGTAFFLGSCGFIPY